MKVCNLVEAYIAYRRSLGEKYQSPAVILRSFARYIGEDKVLIISYKLVKAITN